MVDKFQVLLEPNLKALQVGVYQHCNALQEGECQYFQLFLDVKLQIKVMVLDQEIRAYCLYYSKICRVSKRLLRSVFPNFLEFMDVDSCQISPKVGLILQILDLVSPARLAGCER